MANDTKLSDLETERLLIGRQRRDPEDIRVKLLAWFRQRMPGAESIDLPLPTSPSNGGSSESFFIEPEIRENGVITRPSLMVRIEPVNHRIYELRSIERQYGAMKKLGELGVVPVPEMRFFEDDPTILGDAFLIMDKVDGVLTHDRYHSEGMLHDATPARRTAIWTSLIETVADIHHTDPAQFEFLDRPELGRDPLSQELAVWDSYVRWLGLPLAAPQLRAQRWLHENRPKEIVPGLSWGDARIPNMIFRDDVCHAVLDWETVSLCGAENDLAWLIFYDWFATEALDAVPLDGIPGRDDTLQMWSRLAGREPREMLWHEVAATWRFTLLRDRSLHLAGLKTAPFMSGPDRLVARLDELMDG